MKRTMVIYHMHIKNIICDNLIPSSKLISNGNEITLTLISDNKNVLRTFVREAVITM